MFLFSYPFYYFVDVPFLCVLVNKFLLDEQDKRKYLRELEGRIVGECWRIEYWESFVRKNTGTVLEGRILGKREKRWTKNDIYKTSVLRCNHADLHGDRKSSRK